MALRREHPDMPPPPEEQGEDRERAGGDRRAESFRSIHFPRGRPEPTAATQTDPAFWSDLGLDRIVAAVTSGREEYELGPFFRLPLRDPDDIAFRQEVMRDLERPQLLAALDRFAGAMRTVRTYLARAANIRYRRQRQRWVLDAVVVYTERAADLAGDLRRTAPVSRGLAAFRERLDRYVGSPEFATLRARARQLADRLAAVRYSVRIDGGTVEVRLYAGEADYGAEVAATFARFARGDVRGYAFDFPESLEMNHVEANILDCVADLHPEIFSELEHYDPENIDFLETFVVEFDREIQFYISYTKYISGLRNAGLDFCYAEMTDARDDIHAVRTFDLALADRLRHEQRLPVCNDFRLRGRERILVVTGPNQGGKTTFARTFGQLHHLAALGLPVPGSRARLLLCDRIFTHFERGEHVRDLHGKLADELLRLRDILEAASAESIVVVNEAFASTTFRDGLALSRRILR